MFAADASDLRNATRLSLIYFLCPASVKLLQMHHTAARKSVTWTSIGSALVNRGLIWVFYAALEPGCGTRWPRTMISWTRYTTKGASDPLVGRDLLRRNAPSLASSSTLAMLWTRRFTETTVNRYSPLSAMLGVRAELASVIASVRDAIFTTVLFFFHTLPAAPGIAQGLDCPAPPSAIILAFVT